LGIIIGSALNLFTIPKTCLVSNGVDIESVKLASHNIVNTCKELTNGKNKHSFIRGSNFVVDPLHILILIFSENYVKRN